MNIRVNKEKFILVSAIVFSLFTIFYGVYKPMKNELELNLTDNFQLISQSKIHNFEENIDKSV